MHENVTLTDCRIWTEGRFEPGKLAISGSRIEALGGFPGIRGREIACKGLAVLPAFIDMGESLANEPGRGTAGESCGQQESVVFDPTCDDGLELPVLQHGEENGGEAFHGGSGLLVSRSLYHRPRSGP